jgi:hypothetical protein
VLPRLERDGHPPWYAPGEQETRVELEAFSPPLHHRAEGRPLKRHLVNKVPVWDLCNGEELQPSVFDQWQRQLFENLAAATRKQCGPRSRART